VLARVETHLALRRLQKQLQEANKKFERELALAGSLQSSFFPEEPPPIPGWELSVILKPARETSGDFYDVYTLPDGKLGVLVADVVDKGAAAALYMALSWTLIRTYASEYPDDPERVLSEVNKRIISDTDSSRFVTVFYGVLDPSSGQFEYCNAGHNPPYFIRTGDAKGVERLTKTGVLLGMFEDEIWEKGVTQFDPGDVLILFTDGVTEAQNKEGDFFGRDRLLKAAKEISDRGARDVRESILAEISTFVDGAPQLDDIALVVVARKV
jgi:serine phosphatase RsbU (regulator of sigma subunit)